MRIVKPWGKTLYWVCWSVVFLAVVFALLAMRPNSSPAVTEIVIAILVLIAAISAGRMFRGRSEDRDAPRAWWRMTAAAPASIVLAILSGIWAVWAFTHVPGDPSNGGAANPEAVVNGIVGGLLCLLFVISAEQLARAARIARTS